MIGARPLTRDEEKSINQSFKASNGAFKARDRALFILGLSTGLRISELLSIRVVDVYQDTSVKSSVHIARKNTKGKVSARTIPLSESAKQAITEHLAVMGTHRPDAYLFEGQRKGKAIDRTRAYQILESAYKANGLDGKLGCHAMRKTFAHKVYESLDHDLVKTQRALGHQSINSTCRYLGFNDDKIVEDAILNLPVC